MALCHSVRHPLLMMTPSQHLPSTVRCLGTLVSTRPLRAFRPPSPESSVSWILIYRAGTRTSTSGFETRPLQCPGSVGVAPPSRTTTTSSGSTRTSLQSSRRRPSK
nr:uncharacterized protein LOC123770826 [Procambarus clarkii]